MPKTLGEWTRVAFLLSPIAVCVWYWGVYPEVLSDKSTLPNYGQYYGFRYDGNQIISPWGVSLIAYPVAVILLAYLVALWLELANTQIPNVVLIFGHLANGVAVMLFFAMLYHIMPEQAFGGPGVSSFLDALYFSTVTFTTLGYGDIVPVGEVRLLCALEAVMGSVFIAVLVGLVFRQ